MKLIWLMAAVVGLNGLAAKAEPSPWEESSAALADQVAGILGPGQARLTIRNFSSISTDEIPAIRKLLEQDLKAHGVTVAGAESANTVRVTLSENARERLWVAEVTEGDVTQVTMVHLELGNKHEAQIPSGLTLRRQPVITTDKPILAVIERSDMLIVLEPEEITLYSRGVNDWSKIKTAPTEQKRFLARDPRGLLISGASGSDFEALLPGTECAGSLAPSQSGSDWQVHCRESDDPWPIVQMDNAGSPVSLKAFYNSARNYFTGVVSPSLDVDLPPFYTVALVPRPVGGSALLVNGVEGKTQLAENGALKLVAGTRDWGSDSAVLHSGCGSETQIIASNSGEASSDSLRAYDLPALEAVPASTPLAMGGTVTALWTVPDGKSVLAVVRDTANKFEVDRVTALCN
jgi:hypothetical protein